MPASDDHPAIHGLGSISRARAEGFRFMGRRRIGGADRNGDPLDGVVNLFYVAVVLAVGLLVAALSSLGLGGLLTQENMTVVTNPGTPQMQVFVKEDGEIRQLDMQSGEEVEGIGTLVGSFYSLADGTIVYVPAGSAPPADATPLSGPTPAPGSTTPVPTTTDYPTSNPYSTPTPYPSVTSNPYITPTPSVTLSPASEFTP